ncbi:MAG: xylulokinase [candidate division WOR-3 bacterium]
MGYFLGIDLGTSGVKALVMDERGEKIVTSTVEYPLYTPKVNWAEQNPAEWWEATVKAIKQVISKASISSFDIKGIGLSGQMHGLVALDKEYKVLRPAILWCDQRTEKQCNYITEKIGKERLIELVSNPALTGFTAGKLLWVRDNEPEIYEKIYKILLPKDYIRFCLTGEFATEVSDASGTLFLNVKERKWSRELLDELDIDIDILPRCFESSVISGKVSSIASKETGLKEGTPVVGGGGDQAAQALGTGIVREGVISSTIGTSGVVFAASDTHRLDPAHTLHTFCHAVDGKWHLMGVMLSAGGSLRWLRDSLFAHLKIEAEKRGIDPYILMEEKAVKVPVGSEGLIFLPYLTGERTPYPDPNARGVFFGLSLRHTDGHFIRSVMEGVAFGLRDSLEIIRKLDITVNEIRGSGGGAKSPFWRQIQADINSSPITTVNITEGGAFGVALLAATATGVYSSIQEACDAVIKVTTKTNPIEENIKKYDEYYAIYRSLYPALKDRFLHLSEIHEKHA